jgi:ABC-type uncharacterized transport system involved in gliding motility auxiliary subunit
MPKQKNVFNRSLLSISGLVLILLILIFANFLFAHTNFRWDITEEGLYSLSDNTKEIISALDQEVTIKVFYSKSVVNIPVNIKSYASRVLDFLNEYEYLSNGKIVLEVYDPKPDSEEEEWAQKYGIEGIALPSGEQVYFGLVVMAADQMETISFLDPTREAHLEYDITRIISKVQTAKKLKIGIISSLPIFGSPPMGMGMQSPQRGAPEWLFVTELKKNFDVKQIDASGNEVSADLDLLILHHPKNINPELQFAIDQYVLKGGSLILYLDPFSVADNAPGGVNASSLDPLLNAWGISMDISKAVIDYNLTTNLRNRQNQVERNPAWLSIPQANFNHENIITSQLDSMLLPVAGALEVKKDIPYEVETLVESTENSALMDTTELRFGGVDGLRQKFSPTQESYILALKIRGSFKTAFPDGLPQAEEGAQSADKLTPEKAAPQQAAEDPSKQFLKEAQAAASIIVVADCDHLFDGYYVSKQNFLGFNIAQIFNDNLNFLLNSSEMLAGSHMLIDIRTRGKYERPFTRVQALEQKAQVRWLAREQELVKKVEDTNRKLRELDQQKDPSQKLIISDEQQSQIDSFQEEKRRINKELKLVRRNLRADIESLGRWVKFTNIFLVPLMVCIAGIAFALFKRQKR